ncbi:MAG TPA: HD-GYP domain-containing protein, partial [Chloroflexota bacterium]|nr:HD-GYP domain-containing protein [Chloroflexota bacterium]
MRKQGLPLRVQLYIYGVGAGAAALLLLWLQLWRGPAPVSSTSTLLLVILGGLTIASAQYQLHLRSGFNVNVVTAVMCAALLLFGPPTAMLLVGFCYAAGLALLGLRHYIAERRFIRSWRNILFNSSQIVVTIGVGGLVYFAVLPHTVPAPQQRLENLWAIPLTVAAMFCVNTWLVAIIAGLHHRESPLEVWLSTRKRELLHEAGLYLLGLVTARTAQSDPWIPLVMVLPAAIIYLSTKRYVQLIEQTIGAVEALADTVDRRDPYTFEHSKRVAEYSQRIARAMKLSAEDVEQIRLAARVHDLGKIGVPNHVLHKEGPLTDEEWAVMRDHPEMGYEILAKFPEYKQGRELVRSHHERYDGLGYPAGLTGRHLKVGAQIIAVADTLDAMTSDRPYRAGLPVEVALETLRTGMGSQFHPDVVDALERLMGVDPEAFLLGSRRAQQRVAPEPAGVP